MLVTGAFMDAIPSEEKVERSRKYWGCLGVRQTKLVWRANLRLSPHSALVRLAQDGSSVHLDICTNILSFQIWLETTELAFCLGESLGPRRSMHQQHNVFAKHDVYKSVFLGPMHDEGLDGVQYVMLVA